MKPVASILSKVSAEVVEAKIDGQVAPLKIARKAGTHYMGIGVRHAGDGRGCCLSYSRIGHFK